MLRMAGAGFRFLSLAFCIVFLAACANAVVWNSTMSMAKSLNWLVVYSILCNDTNCESPIKTL